MIGWHTWDILPYVALTVIAVLLIPVILMTYAIMWTPARDPLKDASQLSESDIKDWSRFCSEMKRDGATLGSYRRRILERLSNEVRNQIMYASHQTDYE